MCDRANRRGISPSELGGQRHHLPFSVHPQCPLCRCGKGSPGKSTRAKQRSHKAQRLFRQTPSRAFVLNTLQNCVRVSTLILLIATGLCAQSGSEQTQKLREVRSYYEAAQRFEHEGNWVEAEKAWRAALKLADADARAWTNLGVTLNRQNRSGEAIEAWNRAIVLDPKLDGPYFNIGLTLVKSSDYAGAIAPLQKALRIQANNEAARRALVAALIGSERFREASRDIARLLAQAPHDGGLLELAAQSFIRQNRYAEAVLVLRRRLDLPNDTSQLWAQFGDALDGAKRTPEALDAYRKAVDLDPASALVRYGLGYLYWKLYRYDDAERELTEVLRRVPGDPRSAFTLGDLYLTRGDANKALPFLKTAAEAYPNEFDTRFALGRALMLMGNLEHGIEELRAAVNLENSIADGHFHLGRALMRSGAKEEGKLELEKAQALNDKKREAEGERFRRKLP